MSSPVKSAPMKKGQKRFVVGQRVTAKFWEGFTVERSGRIEAVGKDSLIVSWDGVGVRLTPRCAILKIEGAGK